MRPPDFLIIGAMKAGTTTLYRDLMTHPRIFLPRDKEPGNLCRDSVLTEKGRIEYERLFAHADSSQITGEASTYYTMLPSYAGVPERARRVLPAHARIIYLVRNPVRRAISHHYHALISSDATPDIDDAVRTDERFVAYSSYAMQIEPWLEMFGDDRVCVVVFEEYVKDRAGVVGSLQSWLGLDPMPDRVDPAKAYNTAESKRVARGMWAKLARSDFYKRTVRPLIPQSLKERLTGHVLSAPPPRPAPPTHETLQWLRDQLEPDTERLARVLGREKPIWDLSIGAAPASTS